MGSNRVFLGRAWKCPPRISAEEATQTMKEIEQCGTDTTTKQLLQYRLILGHVGLVMAVASRLASYRFSMREDLLSEAFLTLCVCISRVETPHENLAGYIVKSVTGHLRDYMKSEGTVYIPKDRYRDIVREYSEFNEVSDNPQRDSEYDKLILDDMINSKQFDAREIAIIRLRLLGHTDREVAEQLDLSHVSVVRLRNGMCERVRIVISGQ